MNGINEKINLALELLKPAYLWMFFIIILIFTGVMSAVLVYHWRAYSLDGKVSGITQFLYLSVLIALVTLSGASLFIFTFQTP